MFCEQKRKHYERIDNEILGRRAEFNFWEVMVKIAILIAAVIFAVSVISAKRQSNRAFINKINRIQKSWKARENEISRKGYSYVKRLTGTKLETINKIPLKKRQSHVNIEIPETFDARLQWPYCESLFAVKCQGDCGSCWAVAAASVASDRICIKSSYKVQLNISAENLLSCCKYCVDDGKEGCDGGYTDKAWYYIQENGLVTGGDFESNEGCQPYSIPPVNSVNGAATPQCQQECTNSDYSIPFDDDKHYASSAYRIEQDVEAIQIEILENGPAEASYMVYKDFPYYTEGIYHQTTNEQVGGHSVRIIGWGTENDEPYWLVVNSWGDIWGLDGTFKIRRGTNECFFEENVVAGEISY